MMSRFDSTLRRNGHNSFRNRRDVCWDNLRCIPFLSRIFLFFHQTKQKKSWTSTTFTNNEIKFNRNCGKKSENLLADRGWIGFAHERQLEKKTKAYQNQRNQLKILYLLNIYKFLIIYLNDFSIMVNF